MKLKSKAIEEIMIAPRYEEKLSVYHVVNLACIVPGTTGIRTKDRARKAVLGAA